MKVEHIVALPTDGGWGWIIVAVCFYASAVIDVPSIGFQIILPDLMDSLKIVASSASVIFSSYTLMLYFMGPFAGGVCNRFGFRITTIVGSLMMIIGLIVSYFFHSFIIYIVFFGLLSGTGSSLVYMVGCVAPGFWFEYKRAIALGIASSATGVAVFSVALTAYVKSSLGWNWCFIFWAGCMSILCVLALLLKMPPMVEVAGAESTFPGNRISVTALDVTEGNKAKSLRPIRANKTTDKNLTDKKLKRVASQCGVSVGAPQSAPSRYLDHDEPVGCANWFKCCFCCGSCNMAHAVGARPLYRKDIFYQGSVIYAADLEDTPKDAYGFAVSQLPTQKDVKQEVECHCKIPEAVVRAIKEMVDFSLFKSGVFWFLALGSLLTYIAIYIPFLLIKKVNEGKLDESSASKLTLIMGLGSITGRASIGFLLYFFPKIKSLLVLILFAILGGVAICVIPLNYSFPYQMTMSFLGGALPAVISPLRSVVIIEMLGLEKLTSATGILFFVQGIGCFIGMPMAEFLNETSNTKYLGLVFSGGCYICAGIVFSGIAFVLLLRSNTDD